MLFSIAVTAAAFVGTASVVYLVAARLRSSERDVDSRLAELRGTRAVVATDVHSTRLADWRDRLLPSGDSQRERFVRAGIHSPGAIFGFYLVRLAAAIAPPIAASVLAPFGLVDSTWLIVGGCGAGALCLTLPGLWLDHRVRTRQSTIRRSMSDFLDLAVICVDAGLSIQATIQRIADEMDDAHPVLAHELSIVLRDMEMGTSIDAALKRFAERSGEESVRSLATLARESQRFGTPLSDALRTMAESIRLQRELSAEEAAQKAAVKILMPTMLLIFPAVFIVLAGPAAIQIQEAFAK